MSLTFVSLIKKKKIKQILVLTKYNVFINLNKFELLT